VSHETIYRTLYVQAAARSRGADRASAHASPDPSIAALNRQGRLARADPRRGVDQRAAGQREDRAIPAIGKADLLCGSQNSYIVTLVERHSRYVMLGKIQSRDTRTVGRRTDQAGEEAA